MLSQEILGCFELKGQKSLLLEKQKQKNWAFPGSPEVKTPRVQCSRRGFHPWAGNSDLTGQRSGPKWKKKNKQANKTTTKTYPLILLHYMDI